jgi:hypothetical protein
MTKKINSKATNLMSEKTFGPFTISICELISTAHQIHGTVTGTGYGDPVNFYASFGDLEVGDDLMINRGKMVSFVSNDPDAYVPTYIPTEEAPLDWDTYDQKERVMHHLLAIAESTR